MSEESCVCGRCYLLSQRLKIVEDENEMLKKSLKIEEDSKATWMNRAFAVAVQMTELSEMIKELKGS